ncbi:MAG: metal ABC transporter ATP-binding protein [Candidatus Entotheonellia bacterium]
MSQRVQDHEVIVKTIGLCLGYGQRTVLQQVSVQIRSGEFWFFLGPNGEGKTTFLRAILGMIRPQAGQLWIHPELGQREHIGFVPQRCDINPTLPTTVREFVLLGLVGIHTDRKDEALRLEWALDKVGLGRFEGKDYSSLSGGQRQRALVARALVRRPSVLILDEPTNGLDLAAEDVVLRFLAELNRQDHQTLLFVTHNLAIAARYATHIALFHAGEVASGPRQAVLNRQSLEPIYGVGVEISYDSSGAPAVMVCPPEGCS